MKPELAGAIARQIAIAGPSSGPMGLRRIIARTIKVIRERGIVVLLDVEDVMQEVHLRILAHADDYDPRYALSTWAMTIARNIILNHARAKDPLKAAHWFPDDGKDGDGRDAIPDRALGPEAEARRAEIRTAWMALKRRLRNLNRRHDLSVLRAVTEYESRRRAAAILGMDIGIIRSTLRQVKTYKPAQILARLRAEIEESPIAKP